MEVEAWVVAQLSTVLPEQPYIESGTGVVWLGQIVGLTSLGLQHET